MPIPHERSQIPLSRHLCEINRQMKNNTRISKNPQSDSSNAHGVPSYLERVAEQELTQCLNAAGAVLIEGARACGKTAIARRFAASEVLLDVDTTARNMIDVDPGMLLAGETPRLLDEWQAAPIIWNHVRRDVDARGGKGYFILTGSADPADETTRLTGAGRIIRLRLRTMSLYEMRCGTGQLSLRKLLDGTTVSCESQDLAVIELAELICRGGWPGHLGISTEEAMRVNRNYVDDICRIDLQKVDGVRREPNRIRRFLQSLARNVSTNAKVSTIARGVAGREHTSMKDHTAHSYLNALERIMVVENQPAWAIHLRSSSRMQISPKRQFVDPSIATAALDAGPERLLADFELFGFLFKSMVIRDLRIYAQAMNARVFHYRDDAGLEVDAIIDAGPGRWAAMEIKLGVGRIDEAAKNLLKFEAKIDTRRSGKPATLGVIVDRGYGYRRPDGVSVIPIAALGP